MNKRDIVTKIKDLLIVREDDGSYNLFGKYKVIRCKNGYSVTIYDEPVGYPFSSLKHAVTWCIFEKFQKHKEIRRIVEIDDALGSIDVAIAQHKKLIDKNNDKDCKSIYYAKLIEEKRKKRALTQEIELYIATSKHWQTKKFAENQVK
jgi:hypothetical protein